MPSWIGVAAALFAAAPADADTPLPERQLKAAEALIDAFYSFEPERLRSAMADAKASQPKLLYYQGWAEGGNYRVLDRKPCRLVKPGEAACAIQVKDDLVPALGIPFDVTDTFHLTFDGERVTAVRTSSNDPPEFEQALKWLGRTKPELLEGPCKGFFDGGPTPGDCVRAVVKGFAEFRRSTTPERP
jgi:hypothetical protein